MKINNKGKGALIAAITAAATLLSCGLAAASASAAGVDYLPTIGQVPTYTKFQPTAHQDLKLFWETATSSALS